MRARTPPRTGSTALIPERPSTPRQVRELLQADDSAEQFDDMFADAKSMAVRWVQRQRADLLREADALEAERRAFAEEMRRLRREFEEERDAERERIREDRIRAQQELHHASRRARDDRLRAPELLGAERDLHGQAHGRERNRLRLEQEQHRRRAEDHARMVHRVTAHATEAASVIDINVGGTIFAAPRHMLAQQPRSIFAQWLAGGIPVPRDSQGRVYLDRDPSHFRSILNFLRSPDAPPTVRDATESEGLCREAEHYGVRFFPFPLVYAVGGHDGAGYLSTVELLDVESRRWRSCRLLRAERAHFGAAAMRTRAQVFGGRSAEYQAICDTEYLDCLRGEWLPSADLFTPRRNCAGTGDGDRAFAVGGFDGQQLLNSVEALDARMKRWQQLPPMATPRSSAAATVLDGRLWVLGGTAGAERLKSLEVFDFRSGRWDLGVADLCVARSAGQASVCAGRLFAFGGIDGQHNICRSVECLGGGRWTMLRSMQEPRMDFGCCGLGDMVMVSGGQHGQVLHSSEFYKPELDDWQFGPDMLSPRYGHQLILMNI